MSRLGLQVYTDSTRANMIADWSPFAQGVTFETDEYGYASLTAFIPLATAQSYYYYDSIPLAHIVLGDGAFRAFEGRIEDRALVDGGLRITVFSYWRAMYDVNYSALWATSRYDRFNEANEEDSANYIPSRYRTSTHGELSITPVVGETFGNGVDKGGMMIITTASRKIKELEFDHDVNLDTNWQARWLSFDEPVFTSTNAEWTVTTSGSGTGTTVTLGTARDGIILDVRNNTGGDDTPTGDTGDYYAKITNLRIKTTEGDASGNIFADEIIEALITHVTGFNSGQLSTSTALIDSPGIDLTEAAYYDMTPAQIAIELSKIGDDSTPPDLYEVGVWEDQVLHFRVRGSQAQTWYTDVVSLNVDSTIDTMYNSVYGIYTDSRGLTRRSAVSADAASIAKYGVTRRTGIRTNFSSSSETGTMRDAFIEDNKDITPRAQVQMLGIYTASGAAVPLWMVRSGDTLVLRNLPPTGSAVIDKIRSFRLARTRYDVDTDTLTPTPELETPSLEFIVARNSAQLQTV